MKPKCEDCRYWERHDDCKCGEVVGFCKRFPPTGILAHVCLPEARSHICSHSEDWCGEFAISLRQYLYTCLNCGLHNASSRPDLKYACGLCGGDMVIKEIG